MTRNNLSAYKHKDVVFEYLVKELKRGSIAGPFKVSPIDNLHFSRFGVIPKSGGSDEFRLILDLSFPPHSCVNIGISDADAKVSYQGLDFVIDNIIKAGHGAYLSKFDVKSAYRNVPVHPDDRYLLGMRWMGMIFIDLTLSFGGRSAPSIFTSVADVLAYICSKFLRHSNLSHYLDDYLLVSQGGVSYSVAKRDFDETMSCLEYLEVPIAEPKTIPPSLCLEYLGIILDTDRMEARLSQDKLSNLLSEIAAWTTKRSGTKKSLLSLIGRLMYACQVVHHGRPLLRRLINKANALPSLNFKVHLNKEDRKDLSWWTRLLHSWNGVTLFSFRNWEFIPDLALSSDSAQSLGLGVIFGRRWFFASWPVAKCDMNIAVLELLPIVMACHVWGSEWTRKKIQFDTDNSAVVAALNSGLPRDPCLAFLVRELNFLAIIHSFCFKATHLPGKLNDAADALSRMDFPKFRRLRPEAEASPTPIPDDLFSDLFSKCLKFR